MRRSLQRLRPAVAGLWRYLSGIPPEALPRAGAGPLASCRTSLPPGVASPPPGHPIAEIIWEFRQLRAEWHELRVRRALGREFREVERQVVAEHDAR